MTMDYSPCPKREIWLFLKGSHISETGEATPTKTDVHACDIISPLLWTINSGEVTPTKVSVHALDINSYLHEFFEPIPID